MTSAKFRYFALLTLFTVSTSFSSLVQAEELSAFEKSNIKTKQFISL